MSKILHHALEFVSKFTEGARLTIELDMGDFVALAGQLSGVRCNELSGHYRYHTRFRPTKHEVELSLWDGPTVLFRGIGRPKCGECGRPKP